MANSLVLKSVVYDTCFDRLQRKSQAVEKSKDFRARFVAKRRALNYVAKYPYFTTIGTFGLKGHPFGYASISASFQHAPL